MTIEEFLRARWAEIPPYPGVLDLIDQLEMILEWHKKWPLMTAEEPEFQTSSDGFDFNTLNMRMTQKINVLTQEAFTERFGEYPPASPLLKQMANQYKEHLDFQEEWLL